jgi:hypothetical protein
LKKLELARTPEVCPRGGFPVLTAPFRKVKPIVPLKHWEYPNAMTIALGILTHDGFVIAADSEISAGDYMSIEGQKVHGVMHFSNIEGQESGAIAITGAGDAGYLEGMFGDVADLFSDAPKLEDFEESIAKYLRTFYRRHIIPFWNQGDRADVSLIIGARRGAISRMWTTRRNRFIRCRELYAAVGVGEMYARSILGRICGDQEAETSKLLAAYVIYLVKERIPGCGKQTNLLCVKRGATLTTSLTARQLQSLELLFRDYGRVEAGVWHWVFQSGDPGPGDVPVKVLENLRNAAREILNSPSAK